ncbi:hypothetical protein H0H87_007324 [Tephrocybe sp. NHM501043]|nr:hypothetical protein H0H87_007324 [Tephrocybe sp. NHM501043]
MDVKTIDVTHVREVVKEYDLAGEELDNRVLELEAQLKEIDVEIEIEIERNSLQGQVVSGKLNKRAVIGVFVDVEGEVEIALIDVPGLISIPSDGVAHNVTIVQVHLGGTISWTCVPKKDTKTHFSVKIKNASQYILLRGTGSSTPPSVSHITPNPRQQSDSGFYTKTTTHIFTQTITVHNTKSTPVERVSIAEQIPVSEDAQIQVKLLSPALTVKQKEKETESAKKTRTVAVAKGVSAQWDGADEPEPDVEALGRNGKFDWVCAIPTQGKINLVLQWEVATPARTVVAGLS